MKYRIWNTEYRMQKQYTQSGMQNIKNKIWNTECEIQNMEYRI